MKMKSPIRQVGLPVFVLAVAMTVAGCSGEQEPQAPEVAQVEAVMVRPQPLTLTSELPGRIEPVRVAEVRARVAGIVLSRHFKEGSDVKAGQLLFQIDPAPFRAELARMQGELARAEATLTETASVVKRYEPLVRIEAVSQQDFDAAQAAHKNALAASQAAAAAVETAKLNLGYASVTAPIAGRIGRALVTEGALVGQNETTQLAVIQQLDPIYADFKQSVADVLRLREALEQGRLAGEPGAAAITLTVEGTNLKREGRLLFSDITVDRGTGQVSLRGQFANPDAVLLPGMFARVRIDQGTDPQAIVIPQRAVRRATDGTAQVLVIGADETAEVRPVVTGEMQRGLWHIVEGLKPDERVVVGGAAQPGAKVRVKPETAPSPAAPSAFKG